MNGSNVNGSASTNGVQNGSSINGTLPRNGTQNGSSINGTLPSNGAHANGGLEHGHSEAHLCDSPPASPALNGHQDLPNTPIAICGMGVRLPGGLRSPSDLFDFLAKAGDARCKVPAERFNIDAYYDPAGKTGSINTPYGYYLDVDLSMFDESMFNMSNAEIATMDPAQRLLLEMTREAFETAGVADFRGSNTGVFVGDFTVDWDDLQNIDTLNSAPYQLTGKTDFVLPNRVAFEYNLLGPSVLTKTACSATAEALHQAVLSIRSGSCPSAIVAGANIIMTPRASQSMTAMGILAPDGNCKTFDAGANGFARGESACALYIKPLDDAIRDGNPVRAVIRACDSNADGGDGSRTFGTPNARAQETLIRQTYANAGLSLSETKVVELHGTGTPIGDPLETAAIAQCFGGGTEVTYIGSVKPNLGHGEGGSAMASILKSVVALENRVILPNIKFSKPNPKIAWDRNLSVPVEPLRWPKGARERMSINSFGLGGSNVHMVIDSAASCGVKTTLPPSTNGAASPSGKTLILLSGNSAASIKTMAERYTAYLQRNPASRESMAYTLSARRERLKLGSYCVVDGLSVSEPAAPIENKRARQLAFIFTGQGAQWVGMGKEMMLENEVFVSSIRRMDGVLKKLEHPPDWTLEETLLLVGDEYKGILDPTDRSQPICAAVQIAYVDALASWGIRPSAVAGHSSGEVAAAYAAGVLTSQEAIITAFYRGYACARNVVRGTMAAVGLGRDVIDKYLRPGCVMACENSNSSTTISGDLEAVQIAMADIKEAYPDAFVRQLRVPMGYHSHHMKTIASLYNGLLVPHLKSPKPPQVPYYSTVYGRCVQEGKVFGPHYWQLNMESPVLFRTAVSLMLSDMGPDAAHLEIGPHSALNGPLRQICKETGRTAPYASVAERGQDASSTFFRSMGELHTFGLKIRPPKSEHAYTLPDLPTYPWKYDIKHWSENRVMEHYRFRKQKKHELLGQRILESGEREPAWRNIIKLGEVAWLGDHCVGNDIVFPAAGYIAIAGAAVSQLTDSAAYTVQEVHIAAALLLNETKSTEIVTTFRKHALTSTNDSRWWEFSISSENNGNWTKHCTGYVMGGCSLARPPIASQTFARKVDPRRWYQTLSRVGLNYGPRFIGIDNITASPVEQKATASIMDRQDPGESYALHPTTLDKVLQTWSVAATKGEPRSLKDMVLPTFIEQLYVNDAPNQTVQAYTWATGIPALAVGHSYGMVDGDTVAYVLKGFEVTKVENPVSATAAEQKAWSIEWHPALDFASVDKLIRPSRDATSEQQFVERFMLMAAVEINLETQNVDTLAQPHFRHFLDGVASIVKHIAEWTLWVSDAAHIATWGRSQRQAELLACRKQAIGTPYETTVEMLYRVYSNIRDICEGRSTYLDIIVRDGTLPKYYNESNGLSDITDYFRVLGLNKPQLRILEIGAGTGGTTAALLDALHTRQGERLYQEYTITDVSAGFVNQCRERFKDYQKLKYAVCDITADPLEQGFEAGAYDLIVASNVLHATPVLKETLTRCHTLLKPDGYLFMQEVCSNMRNPDMVMGLFEGWWVGIEDGRVERPVLSIQQWDSRLRDAGFAGVQNAVRDNAHEELFAVANILARPAEIKRPETTPSPITLLKPSPQLSSFGKDLKRRLESAGRAVDEAVWSPDLNLPSGQDVISLMDIEPDRRPLLADISEQDLSTLVQVLGDLSGQAVLWLMPPASTACTSPDNGQMLGAARCLRAELALHLVTLELDTLDGDACQAAMKLLEKIQDGCSDAEMQQSGEEATYDIESEYVWRDGQMLLSRMHTLAIEKELEHSTPVSDARHLVIGQPGLLQTMHWTSHDLPPLAAEDVQVRVTNVGLNFHDVASAIGIMTPESMEDDGYHGLGCEGSAVVTATGANVEHVSVGDRVIVMAILDGVFATEMQLNGAFCERIPDSVSDEDAAGLVIPYLTVLWSLCEKARLRQGQSLLVHSAAGGVGIAAIHVARWLGLELHCTVGSPAKINFLVNELGVPRERIYHSRDDSFVADVQHATGGRGVDAVLNSLSGELLHASWKCVAAHGCMLDLGKRDFLGRGRLAMNPFAGNRSFFGIDLATLAIDDPLVVKPFLRQVMELLENQSIKPLLPTTVYTADRIQDSFRYMQKGVHTGRIVVKMPTDAADLPLAKMQSNVDFKPDATYLLTGGMGGLGKSIVSWMVNHGARHIAVISPSAGKRKEHIEFIEEMRQLGCELRCFAGDVGSSSFMRGVVDDIDLPIKGVVQLAMVLCDTGFLNMDHESWSTVTNPKVRGTWNLHTLLPTDMDFFVMCSSFSGTLGGYGQSNYAAANAYLDAFVHYRHTHGLPASVLDIAAVGDVGYVASTKDVAERLERTIVRFMSEEDFLLCLQYAFVRSDRRHITPPPPTSTVAFAEASQTVLYNEMSRPLSDQASGLSWRGDRRLCVFRNVQGVTETAAVSGNEGLRSFLVGLSSEPERLDDPATATFFAREIARRVFVFLMKEDAEIDTSQTLSSMGADSLVAIEIRNWWKQTLGIEISVLELGDAGTTMEMLGTMAVERLKEKHIGK